MATGARFYATSRNAAVSLTTSLQLLIAGVVNQSFVNVLFVVNTGASTRTLTITDESGNILGVIQVSPSVGILASTPTLDIMTTRLIARVEYDAYGNSGIRLNGTGNTLKAKQDVGTDLIVHVGVQDY